MLASVSSIILGKGAKQQQQEERPATFAEISQRDVANSTVFESTSRHRICLNGSTEMASQVVNTLAATLSSTAGSIASRRSQQLTDRELCLAEQGLCGVESDLSSGSGSDEDSFSPQQSADMLRRLRHTTTRTANSIANATYYRSHNQTRFS
jgi:hypothetical protein